MLVMVLINTISSMVTQDAPMSDYLQDVELTVNAFVDNDFEMDDDGKCYIVNLIYVDEEDPVEARVDLDGVVENLIEHNNDLQGYQDLFSIAHEFARQAERLRDVASRFEDSEGAVLDLFDAGDGY